MSGLNMDAIRDDVEAGEGLRPEQARLLLALHDSAHRRAVMADDALEKVLLIMVSSLEGILKNLRSIQTKPGGVL